MHHRSTPKTQPRWMMCFFGRAPVASVQLLIALTLTAGETLPAGNTATGLIQASVEADRCSQKAIS